MFYVYVAFQKKICKIYQLCCNRKVTNLKQQKNIILQFCRFKTWHRSCWSKIQVLAELCFILEVLRKKFIFFPFLASRGLPHLMVPYCLSSIFKVINVFSSDFPSLFTSPFDCSLLPPSLTFKDPCSYIGVTWIMQVNLLRLKSPDW